MLIAGFNQHGRGDNFISGFFNHLVDVAFDDEAHQYGDENDAKKFLLVGDVDVVDDVFHFFSPFLFYL